MRRLLMMTMTALLLSCTGANESSNSSAATTVAVEGRWQLVRIDAEPALGDVWMELTADRITGSAGCNGFSGHVERPAAGQIKITRLAATKKHCPDAALMAQESTVLSMLSGVASLSKREGRLVLETGAGGQLQWDQAQADAEDQERK